MIRTQNNNTYYIAPFALSFSENALGDSEKVSVSLQQGTKILVYTGTPIGFSADGSYDRWLLYAYPTAFSSAHANKMLYIYARLTKVGRTALVIYSPNLYDVYGRILNEQGELADESAVEDADFYYVRIGQVSAPSEGERVISYDSGLLGTDRGERESGNDYFSLDVEGNLVFNYPVKMLEIVGSLSVGGMLMALGGLTIGNGKKFVFDGVELSTLLTMARGLEADADMNDSQLATAGYIKLYIKKKLEELDDLYLSKVHNDTAAGKISFQSGIDVSGLATFHDAEEHGGMETHQGDETHAGVETHSNTETHSGAETHSGYETHIGEEVHYGVEEHWNAETHAGDETHGGHVEVNQKFSINENAIAQILGAMFLGRSTDFVSGLNGSGGKIGKDGTDWHGELDSLFVRKLATVVRGVFSELVSANPTDQSSAFFLQGFNGHGARVWFDEVSGWNMELDTLTVRRIMYIFELVIQRIRSVGGILLVSAGSGKIKHVKKVLVRRSVDVGSGGTAAYGEEYESYYKITFEDTNTFVRHDLMRCQRWNNGRYDGVTADDDALLPDQRAMQYYWVEVAYPDTSAFSNSDHAQTPTIYKADDDWNLVVDEEEGTPTAVEESFSTAYDILVPRSEFITGRNWLVDDNGNYIDDEGNIVDESERIEVLQESEPQEGDECVLMGNTQYTKRQNYIYISATEDGVPRIDVMDGCNSKGGGGNLRCRVGCLDGIVDDFWRGLEQPNGYGLYSDNAWLKGKFIVKIAGVDKDLGTLFEVLDGTIRSTVSALREDLIGDEGYISNNVFADGWDKWCIYADGELYNSNGVFIDDGVSLLSDLGTTNYARLVTADEDTSGESRNYIVLKGSLSDVRGITQLHADLRNLPEFELDDNDNIITKTIAISFYAKAVNNCSVHVKLGTSSAVFSISASTKWKKVVTVLEWDGVGDFTVYTDGGAVCLYGFVASQDVNDALIDKFTTQIQETANQIQLYSAAFTWNETLGKYEVAGFAELVQSYGTLSSTIRDYQTATNSSIQQLSNSISSSVSKTTELAMEDSNKYVRDPFFAEGNSKFTIYDSWNVDAGNNTYMIMVENEGGKKRVNMLIFDGYVRGIVPQLNWANCPDESSFQVFIKMSVWAKTACRIYVYRTDGEETMVLVHQRELEQTNGYVLLQLTTTSTRSSLFYFCCCGVNSQPCQLYINGFSITDDALSQALVSLNSSISQTDSRITQYVGRVETLESTVQTHTAQINLFSDNISLAVARGISAELGNIFLTPRSPFEGGYRANFMSASGGKVVTDYITDDKVNKCLIVDDSTEGADETGIEIYLNYRSDASEYDGKNVVVKFKLKTVYQGDINLYRRGSSTPLYTHHESSNVWVERSVELTNFDSQEELYFTVENCKMYLEYVDSSQDFSSIVSASVAQIDIKVDAISSRVDAFENTQTGIIRNVTTMQQTDHDFTFRVESLENTIFSNVYPPFDYTVWSNDPDVTESEFGEMVCKAKDSDGEPYLKISDPDNNVIWVSFGLSSTAEDADLETIKVRIRGTFNRNGSVLLYYGSDANSYIDLSQDFDAEIRDFEYTVHFEQDYGIRLRVDYGGEFHLYGIYGKTSDKLSPASVLKLSKDYFLAYASNRLIDTTKLNNTLTSTLAGYLSKTEVADSVSGFYSKSDLATMFSATIDPQTGEYNIASQIATYVHKVTENGKTYIESGVHIKADAIHLEGYTTINGHFKVDEEGNAEMNDCTIAGVLNNLIQTKTLSLNEVWYLNPMRFGSIIKYIPNDSNAHTLKLPTLYSDHSGNVYISDDVLDEPFDGITVEEMRQCIGKKFYIFAGISSVSNGGLVVQSYMLLHTSMAEFSLDNVAVGGLVSQPQRTYTRENELTVPATTLLILECKLGSYEGRECIYWEAETSMSRSETTYYLFGEVKNEAGELLPEAVVEFQSNLDSSSSGLYQVQADLQGRYALQMPRTDGETFTAKVHYDSRTYTSAGNVVSGVIYKLSAPSGQNLTTVSIANESARLDLKCHAYVNE